MLVIQKLWNTMTNFPNMATSIAYGLASIVGAVAFYFIWKKALPWLQAYRNRQEQAAAEAARRKAQQENQTANSDSDSLDQREREHDGG